MSDRNFSTLDHTSVPSSAYADSSEPTVRHLAEDVSELQQEAQASRQLRNRVNWLSGLLVISLIVLGGGLIGTTLSLRREQARLQSAQGELSQQIESATEADAQSNAPAEAAQTNAERLNRLEQQLEALNRQAEAITEQAKGLTQGLPTVSAEQWAELQARIAEVEKSIRETVAGDTVTGEVSTDQINRQFDTIDELVKDFRTMLDSLTQTGAEPEPEAPTSAEPAN